MAESHWKAEIVTEQMRVQAVITSAKNQYNQEVGSPAVVVGQEVMQRDEAPVGGVASKLKQLVALKESGALTEDEF